MIRICRHRLPSRSFATKGAKKKVAAGTIVPKDAVHMAKAGATAKFDETIEVAVRLNLDPRKPNQAVRRSIQLPHGTGKSVRVAVFAKGDNIDLATEAGADVVGGEELVDAILKGKIDFDRCIASPDMMPLVGRVARILGPKGLMPNPKLGTVTPNVANAVKAAKKGQIQIRTEKKWHCACPDREGKLHRGDAARQSKIADDGNAGRETNRGSEGQISHGRVHVLHDGQGYPSRDR